MMMMRRRASGEARAGTADVGGVADGARGDRRELGDVAGGGEPSGCREVAAGHGVED